MKRFISALLLAAMLSGSAFALTDKEYLSMKKQDESFRKADRRLNEIWREIKSVTPAKDFKAIEKDNASWIKTGRDEAAKFFINNYGLDKAGAYTEATNQRITYLSGIRIKQVYGAKALTQEQAQGVVMNYLQKNNKIEKGQLIMIANIEPEKEYNGEFWMFRHASDLGDRTSTINFYYVRVNDGAVYVMDVVEDKLIPAE